MTTPQPISFVGATADFRAGKATPRDLLERCLARVEEFEPAVGAFVCHDIAAARSAADRSAERWRAGRPLSPIDGMPIAHQGHHRDRRHADRPGLAAVGGLSHWRAIRRASHALREAGAVILGKTTTTEFAADPSARHPQSLHDSKRTPGGSSSGSAAAVGAAAWCRRRSAPRWSARSCGRRASAARRLQAERRRDQPRRLATTTSARAATGALGATLADAWAVLRAIADRAGGDPGYPGLTGDVELRRRAQRPRALGRAAKPAAGTSPRRRPAQAFAGGEARLAEAGVELAAAPSRSRDRGAREERSPTRRR